MSAKTALDAVAENGEFKRKPAVFRDKVSRAADAKYPPEANRYLLYVSYACPWACRCLAFLAFKGLGDVIKVIVVDPIWQRTRPEDEKDEHRGWPIQEGLDPVYGAKFIRDIYEKATPADAEPTQIFSVPVFFDSKTRTIVNNESSDIIRFLNTEFNDIAKHPDADLYPEQHREAIDKMNDSIYNSINNGVYRCGFARSQQAYDQASHDLFTRLDELEELLGKQRFLVAGTKAPTEADVRLFVTLIRFDEVYVVHFKTNKKQIKEYKNLHAWLRDMWQWNGGEIQSTVRMDHIKQHYYGSHHQLNPFHIIPTGPNALAGLEAAHGRDAL